MKSQVKVTANEAGQVVNVSKNNSEYGYVRVEQTRIIFEGGWARPRTISALISGKVEHLRDMKLSKGDVLPGNITVCEQLEPFNSDNPEKDLKIAGSTGIPCTLGGEPIYRKTFYSEDAGACDVLLSHDNTDAIKDAYAKAEEANEGANL